MLPKPKPYRLVAIVRVPGTEIKETAYHDVIYADSEEEARRMMIAEILARGLVAVFVEVEPERKAL